MMDQSSASAPAPRTPVTTGPRRGTPSPEHLNLWADSPILHTDGSGYAGQVIVEVWEDGRTLSVMKGAGAAAGGTPPGLVPAALAALRGSAPVRAATVPLAQTPMTGPHPAGAAFLRRVIVELHAGGP